MRVCACVCGGGGVDGVMLLDKVTPSKGGLERVSLGWKPED